MKYVLLINYQKFSWFLVNQFLKYDFVPKFDLSEKTVRIIVKI